jgi:hypothetical protein
MLLSFEGEIASFVLKPMRDKEDRRGNTVFFADELVGHAHKGQLLAMCQVHG